MLSKKLAQKVANQVMRDIDYNINVMDEDGRIIASGDQERIGNIHQGAKLVMKNKKRNYIYEDTKTEKQGINDPIFINDKCVGVVGISGYPDEVLKVKNVVNSLFYFLISRDIELSEDFSEKELKQKVLRKIIYKKVDLFPEDVAYFQEKEFDISESMYVVVIEGKLREFDNTHFIYFKSNDLMVLLVPEKNLEEVEMLESFLNELLLPGFSCGISKVKNQINIGYQKAIGTLRLIKMLHQTPGIHYYRDNKIFVNSLLSYSTELEEINKDIFLLRQDSILYETLLCFIQEDGSVKETADKLIIHRNTLHYRLTKIRKMTGFDPYNFKGLANLINGLIIIEKKNKEYSM